MTKAAKIIFILLFGITMVSCSSDSSTMGGVVEEESVEEEAVEEEVDTEEETEEQEEEVTNEPESIDPPVDLSNWKVTLPISENGKTVEVEPPAILDYTNNEQLKEFMFNDVSDSSLVFFAYPDATTANSSYSRTELREQIEPGSNNVNWTFAEGGRMKGTLAIPEISKDAGGEFHRTIIMQIHGRLTNEQRDLIGEDDNNAPPVLKIYWQKGKVRVLTKKLKDENVDDTEVLRTDAWEDDEGYTFDTEVGTDKFTLEVIASEGRLEIILNEEDSVLYEGNDMERWGVFENYFKAGNYLQTTDEGSSAKVKYYDLEVTH